MTVARHAFDIRSTSVLHDRDHAEGYVASVCFKTGPPRLVGVELEWTVHDCRDLAAVVPAARLARALGPHAPRSLRPYSQERPLPGGGLVTVEPGGQVEISAPPLPSLSRLLTLLEQDIAYLAGLLASAGLVLGDAGTDPHRPPRRTLNTPRYAAMQAAFDRLGPHGGTMMCSTAGLQVCLDAGLPDRVAARWSALHALGPVLLAAFANSSHLAGHRTGWASTRMRTWYATDPSRTRPAGGLLPGGEAASDAYARYAMDATLLCVQRPAGSWDAPPGVTFGDWLAGATPSALPTPPTVADLDYHLGTLFPPVRPRGYLEVRYLDAQPLAGWTAPVAVLAALFADEETVDRARELAAPAARRWTSAARYGLADPVVARAADGVLALALTALDRTDLTPRQRAVVVETVDRRLTGAEANPRSST